MKLLITPLLSGLLENDFNRMTEFDDFFKEIEKINRKKVMSSILLCIHLLYTLWVHVQCCVWKEIDISVEQ